MLVKARLADGNSCLRLWMFTVESFGYTVEDYGFGDIQAVAPHTFSPRIRRNKTTVFKEIQRIIKDLPCRFARYRR